MQAGKSLAIQTHVSAMEHVCPALIDRMTVTATQDTVVPTAKVSALPV